MRFWMRTILGVTAVALAACGGDETPTTTAAPMGAPTTETAGIDTDSNQPPRVERLTLRPLSPQPGERIVASVEASDPDGDPVRLTYRWRMNGQRIGDGPSLQTEGFPKGATIELRVLPHDGTTGGPGASATATIDNQRPVMLGIVIEPLGDVTVMNDVAASPRATDPDGDELEYEYTWWINGEPSDVDGPVLPKEELSRGDKIELAVWALDGTTESDELRSQPFEVSNSAPTITSTPGGFESNGTFRYQVAVDDPDGDRRLRYRMLEGPKGMKLDLLNGLVTWTPGEDQAGTHFVAVEVDDMFGGKATQKFEVNVAFEPATAPANQAE